MDWAADSLQEHQLVSSVLWSSRSGTLCSNCGKFFTTFKQEFPIIGTFIFRTKQYFA